MKTVVADGIEFRFTKALDAFVFDETDTTKPETFHGVHMKAVDVIAEFEKAYVYVELKEYENPSKYDASGAANDKEKIAREKRRNELKEELKHKFRDSYLYRHAEQKVDKPVHYICLINFPPALNNRIQESLQRELPVGVASPRWKRALVESCQVVNMKTWNKNFPQWPVARVSDAGKI